MANRKAYKPILFITLYTVILIYFFQNCAKQPLEAIETASISYEAPKLNLKSEFCPIVKTGSSSTSKFVFIIDLSASNIGDWKVETIGGLGYYYWDSTKATDINGSRFDSIKTFVDTCATTLSNSFAVIGFSGSSGVLSGGSFSCTNVAFGSSDNLKTHLDAFKNRQLQDAKWYEQWIEPKYLTEKTPSSIIFKGTSYSSAMKCLENLMSQDLISESSADNYNVFYISDGKPADPVGSGCNISTLTPEQKETCYFNSVTEPLAFIKTAAISKGKKFILGGIYYGLDKKIPVVLDSISKEGGVPEATVINSFETEQNALCKLVVTQFATEFKPDSYVMIPLTVLRKEGKLLADSDMDGVTDEDEINAGSDPTNPRSLVEGVLDGICARLGGYEQCLSKRQLVSCNKDLKNDLSLTDCDFRILGLNNLDRQGSWGVDSDMDGLNDYLEIIKGLDPSKSDLLLDPDNDGLSNKEELIKGTDPFVPDSDILSNLLNEVSQSFNFESFEPQCPLGAYSLSLARMQVEQTLQTPLHQENEHVLMIQLRYSPTNSTQTKKDYYGSLVKVQLVRDVNKKGLNIDTLIPEMELIPQSQLIKWGEVW